MHRAVDAALAALSVALAPEPGIAALAGLVEALAAPAPLHDEHDEGMETVWLEAEMRGRGLLSHESHGFRKHGLPGSLAWPQKPCSDRGGRLMPTQTVAGRPRAARMRSGPASRLTAWPRMTPDRGPG